MGARFLLTVTGILLSVSSAGADPGTDLVAHLDGNVREKFDSKSTILRIPGGESEQFERTIHDVLVQTNEFFLLVKWNKAGETVCMSDFKRDGTVDRIVTARDSDEESLMEDCTSRSPGTMAMVAETYPTDRQVEFVETDSEDSRTFHYQTGQVTEETGGRKGAQQAFERILKSLCR